MGPRVAGAGAADVHALRAQVAAAQEAAEAAGALAARASQLRAELAAIASNSASGGAPGREHARSQNEAVSLEPVVARAGDVTHPANLSTGSVQGPGRTACGSERRRHASDGKMVVMRPCGPRQGLRALLTQTSGTGSRLLAVDRGRQPCEDSQIVLGLPVSIIM